MVWGRGWEGYFINFETQLCFGGPLVDVLPTGTAGAAELEFKEVLGDLWRGVGPLYRV